MIQMSWPPDFVCIVFSRSIQLFLFCLQKFPAKESTIIMKEKGSCKLVLKLMGGWDSMYRPRVSGLHAGQSPWKVPSPCRPGPLATPQLRCGSVVGRLAGPLQSTHDSCLEAVDRPQWARGQPHLDAVRAMDPSSMGHCGREGGGGTTGRTRAGQNGRTFGSRQCLGWRRHSVWW